MGNYSKLSGLQNKKNEKIINNNKRLWRFEKKEKKKKIDGSEWLKLKLLRVY